MLTQHDIEFVKEFLEIAVRKCSLCGDALPSLLSLLSQNLILIQV